MKQIILLLKKDIIRFWEDKPAVLLTFILPAVLIIIFGNIFSGDGGPRGKIDVILVNRSNSEVAKLIESKLDSTESLNIIKTITKPGSKAAENLTMDEAKSLVKEGQISTAIILPVDFFTDTSSSVKIKIFYDPKNDIESALVQGTIQQTIMSEAPKLIPVLMQRKAESALGLKKGISFNEKMADVVSEYWGIPKDSILNYSNPSSITESFGDNSSDIFKNMISIDSEQLVGKNVKNPGVTRIAGGWAMMFLLFTIVGAASSLFEEKQEGSLRRLLCMPVKRSQILWSKYIYSILLGIVQLFIMFLISWLLFDVDIFSNFINLFIMITASAMAAVSFGMLITSFATSLSQANGVATLIILVMSAIGGSWFPISLLPDWMQTFSKMTIVYWSVEGFLQVLWRQADFSAIVINVIILVSIAFVVNFYSIVRIRKGKIFN